MRDSNRSALSILVVHPEPSILLRSISRRFPAAELHGCKSHEVLRERLDSIRPQVVLSFKEPKFKREMLLALKNSSVKWLHVASAGADHVPDLGRDIAISTSAGIGAAAIAEYVVGAMLSANCRFLDYVHQQAGKVWQRQPWSAIRGKTLILVGVGNIGKQIATLVQPLGLRIIGIRATEEPVPGVAEIRSPTRLLESLEEGDFISLQLPLSDATRHLIGRAALSAMRETAWLINVGRGPLVDEAALIEALQARRIAGAVLDVFENEPLPERSSLWSLPNVIVTPHASAWTSDWEHLVVESFCANLQHWINLGRPLAIRA